MSKMAFNFIKYFTIDLNLLHKLAPLLSLKLEYIKVPLLWSNVLSLDLQYSEINF